KKPAFADWYISGKATTVLAMTAAYHVNMMVPPKRVSYRSPMRPLFPNIIISRKPTTVGGRTKGSIKSVSIMTLPLNSALAMKRAAAVARTNTIRRASIATWSDNSTGAMNCSVVKLLNNKTIIFKYLLCFFRLKVIIKLVGSIRVLRFIDHARRINDRSMGVLRCCFYNFHFITRFGVCPVDETGVHIAGFHIGQHRPDIFSINESPF